MHFKFNHAKNISSDDKLALEKAIRTISMSDLLQKIAESEENGQTYEDVAKKGLSSVTGLVDSLSNKPTLVAAFAVVIQGFASLYEFVENNRETAALKR